MNLLLAQLTNLPPNLTQDIAKVLSDFGLNINYSDIVQVVAAIFIIARILRKGVPDNWQTGALGTFLKHAALEVNPQPPTPIATTQPPVNKP
jgi:hypothetical protein